MIAEYVRIPGYQEPHTPEIFNSISFMRYRYDTGQNMPAPVQAVIIGQTGMMLGVGYWYEMATQIVNEGEGDIEVWVIDRRENCLEDTLGFKQAIDARNAQIAHDYYFGPQKQFIALQQGDVPFMAYWGLECYIKDVECVLNLIPKACQSRNVFLAGHSLGSTFAIDFASYEFPDGEYGYEKLAGLILLDSMSAVIVPDNEASLPQWQTYVQTIIDGTSNRFTPLWQRRGRGIRKSVQCMRGYWDPSTESPNKLMLPGLNTGGPPREFRVTNEASGCYGIGHKCGRLDFLPVDANGVPTGNPDPSKVYGWLSGGYGKPAGDTHPVTSMTACLTTFFAGGATNIKPVTYNFPVSGQVNIYSGSPNTVNWYDCSRYNLDVIRAMDRWATEMNVTGWAHVDIPLITWRLHTTGIQEYISGSKISDWTQINPAGVTSSAQAQQLNAFPPDINCQLYSHNDFAAADNALGKAGIPGSIGANVVTNTVVPWIMARVHGKGKTPVPPPGFFGIE